MMASEHEHNAWRIVAPSPLKETEYFYGVCRVCGAKGRRLVNTDAWEIIEPKPTYQELEQQLAQAREQVQQLWDTNNNLGNENDEILQENAQARALLERTNDIFSVMVDVGIRNANQLLEEIRAFLASKGE